MQCGNTKQHLPLLFFFFLTNFLISCNIALSDNTSSSLFPKQYTDITCNVNFSGAYPSQLFSNNSGRTAIPAIQSGSTFFAEATATGHSPVSGDISPDYRTFTIRQLEFDVEWTITVGIKSGTNTILSDSDAKTFSYANNTYEHDFMLKPNSTSGTGAVGLSMSIPTAIDEVLLSCSNAAWPVSAATVSGGTATVSASSVPSGSYLVQMDFKQNGFIIYSDVQVINVFSYMTTDSWLYGESDGPITSSGYVVTQSLIDAFLRTRIYVGTTTLGSASNDTGTGSPFAPYETINKAINYIVEKNQASANYTILVTGEIEGAQLFNTNLNGKANSITLEGVRGLNNTGIPQDSLNGGFDSSNNGTTVTVKTNVPVTIKNLLITGGYGDDDCDGGGISILNTTSKVTLDAGAHLKGNYTKYCGGGVYNQGGKLTIKSGAEISGNHEVSGNSDNGGGGVFSYNGTLIISGGVIKGNFANNNGGGVYIEHRSTGLPAAYIYGNTIIGGSTAEDKNTASGNGGGLYNVGCTIYFGIDENGNEIAWTGGIRGNQAVKGGGLYNTSNSYCNGTIIMRSGDISKNTAANTGGGIHNEKQTSKVFLYGTALVGLQASEPAQAVEGKYSNKANGGAGVNLADGAKLYLGYKPGTGDTIEEANYAGGICYNYASSTSVGGGGIQASNNTRAFDIKIHAGEISYNYAAGYGGGIYSTLAEIDMSGGTIKSNVAGVPSSLGNAIYISDSAKLYMSKTATIDSDNDVCLPGSMKIVVKDKLSPAGRFSAKVTPWMNYTETKQVVDLDTTGTNLQKASLCFTVTPDGAEYWAVSGEGKLQRAYTASQALDQIATMTGTQTLVIFGEAPSDINTVLQNAIRERYNETHDLSLNLDLSDLSVTSMPSFGSCNYGIKTVILPTTMRTFGSSTFSNNYTVQELIVSDASEYFCTIDGVLYNKAVTQVVAYPRNKAENTFELPSTVNTIAGEAFQGTKVKTITNLSQIEHLTGMSQFAYGSLLEEANFSGLLDETVTSYVFTNNSKIQKVTFSANVNYLAGNVLRNCAALTEVHFLGSVPPRLRRYNGNPEFYNCPNVRFYVPYGSKAAYLAATESGGFADPDVNAFASEANFSDLIIEE